MWTRIRKVLADYMTGILGTLAFHMVLVIAFLFLKMSSIKSDIESIIYLDLGEDAIQEWLPEQNAELDAEVEQRVNALLTDNRRNIPVNIATRMEEEISTEKYLEQLQEQMDASRQDEWLRNQERLRELTQLDEQADAYAQLDETEEESDAELYRGPTTIVYSLEGRYHIRLPIPVYKCEGEGEITITIVVDQRGRVVQVQVPDDGNSFNEICLSDAAKKSALNTRFNTDFNAPLRQKGTITYHFFAQ
jgi:hypothetical protein